MDAVLYALPASHPCAAVERALALKHVGCRRVELIPGPHRIVQKAVFGATTVPAIRLSDGTKVVGSRPIMRELDARVPEPRLVPETSGAERAEEWGDQVLQSLVRRVDVGRPGPGARPAHGLHGRREAPRPAAGRPRSARR